MEITQSDLMKLRLALRKNTILMFAFWLTVIVVTAFTTIFHAELGQVGSQLLLVIFTYAATYAWFIEDARELGLIPSKALIVGVTTAASICVPYYLIRYKGIKRALLSTGKFASLFFVSASLFGTIPL